MTKNIRLSFLVLLLSCFSSFGLTYPPVVSGSSTTIITASTNSNTGQITYTASLTANEILNAGGLTNAVATLLSTNGYFTYTTNAGVVTATYVETNATLNAANAALLAGALQSVPTTYALKTDALSIAQGVTATNVPAVSTYATSAGSVPGGVTTNQLGYTLYVTTNGSSGNDGLTWATAKRYPTNAFNMIVPYGGTLMISNGNYGAQMFFARNYSKSVEIDGVGGVDMDYGIRFTNFVEYGNWNVYTCAVSGDILQVIANNAAGDSAGNGRCWIWEEGTRYGAGTNTLNLPFNSGINPMNVYPIGGYRCPSWPLQWSHSLANMTNANAWQNFVTNAPPSQDMAKWDFGIAYSQASGLAALSNTNGYGLWFVDTNTTPNTLYVVFSDGQAPNGRTVVVPSGTNNFINITGTGSGSLTIKNIHVWYPYVGIDYTGLKSFHGVSDYIFGAMAKCVWINNNSDSSQIENPDSVWDNCEFAGSQNNFYDRGNLIYQNASSTNMYSRDVLNDCYSHDAEDEVFTTSAGPLLILNRCNWGWSPYGAIADCGIVKGFGCAEYSCWQGNEIGPGFHFSIMEWHNSSLNSGILIFGTGNTNPDNVKITLDNTYLDSPINSAANSYNTPPIFSTGNNGDYVTINNCTYNASHEGNWGGKPYVLVQTPVFTHIGAFGNNTKMFDYLADGSGIQFSNAWFDFLHGRNIVGDDDTNLIIDSPGSSVPTGHSASSFYSLNTILDSLGVSYGGGFAWGNQFIGCVGVTYAGTGGWAVYNLVVDDINGSIGHGGLNAFNNTIFAGGAAVSVAGVGNIIIDDGTKTLNLTNNYTITEYMSGGYNLMGGAVQSGSGYGFIVTSNSWAVTSSITNSMSNFSTARGVSSNGVPVDIYMSNGVPFIYYETSVNGGILP